MSSSPDVLVVGGGAIGAVSALELAGRGARVTLLERGLKLAAGCSAGNAGLICPSHALPLANPAALRSGIRWMLRRDSPLYVRPRPAIVPWLARFAAASTPAQADAGMRLIRSLSLASLELHAQFASAGIDTGFTRRGVLNVYETERGLAAGRREADLHARAGLRSEHMAPERSRAVEPALVGSLAGAVFYPNEAHCDPERFVNAVGAAATEAGADIRLGVEALALRRDGSYATAVDTTAGPVRAGTVVVAAGAWTPGLARQLGIFVPVEGAKGYHIDLESRDGDPEVPVFLQEARVIATPLPGRLRIAGTLELSGLELDVDRVRLGALLRASRRILPVEGRRTVGIWRGLRPCAPDGLPIVGRQPAHHSVVLATGHAMMGLTLAPATGRLVAEIVAGEMPSHDISALRPERFRRLPIPLIG
ncbi:MAG: NAD(P)/FAD-dependent oxidoreductase [Gemmatimonadota bacterium]